MEAARLALSLCCLLPSSQARAGFDWERDRILLRNGKEERGVVIQDSHPDRVVLLREGNRRVEFARAEIARVDELRDRVAAFLAVRRPGLSLAAEWGLAEDARRAGLEHLARLQAYQVLLCDPGHAGANELLGHERSGAGWKWILDEKPVDPARFDELCRDWNHRLVLESEHFTVETDCGLARGLEVAFDLESVYAWFLENLGPHLDCAEDVDDPQDEKMTFLVHQGRDSPGFLQRTSEEGAYYDPSGGRRAVSGSLNVARTYYLPDGARPQELFELATECLLYSTLVLGRTRDEADDKIRRLSHWAELGLGYWVAQHVTGEPGHPALRRPFTEPPGTQPIGLDPTTARASLQRPSVSHLLLRGRHELPNLVTLPYLELVGDDPDVPLARARCASFVTFLIEASQPVETAGRASASGRDALWTYLREVYCTQQAYASDAFDAGLGVGTVVLFEDAWKAWTAGFTN